MKNSFLDFGLLLKRLFIVFFIYQVSRVFFYIVNISHFTDVNLGDMLTMMWGGLRFDITAIIYLNSLFIVLSMLPITAKYGKVYQQGLWWLFIVTNGIGYALNLMDTFYFDYVLKRSTAEVFMFTGEGNIGLLLLQFVKDFWLGFVVFGLFIWITYLYYKRTKIAHLSIETDKKFYASGLITLLFTLLFMVIGIRSSVTGDRPLHQNNAGAYVKKPLQMAIVLNTPFTMIRTIQKSSLKPIHYFDKKDLVQIYSPEMHFTATDSLKRKNIMIIIVESLSKEYTGLLNRDIKNYKGFTPFLDSLMLQSHTYVNAYANGRRSIDAMPSVLASVPSLTQSFVLSPYGADQLLGLGSILKKKGYKTAFFHGAKNGSMGFDAFVKLAGIDEYYGMNEYGNDKDFDGHWGIPDDKFLQYTAKQLDTFKQPFMATLFTLSSHHPFTMPTEKEYEGKFKGGPLPIHKTIEYFDYSLRKFFSTAQKMPWYQNTIFVITADHCNLSYLPEYKSSTGHHAIPILFFEPGNPKEVKLDSTLMQQVDIMPRLLDKINYSGDLLSFGNNPQSHKKPFVINNISNGTWEYMQGDYLLRFRENKPVSFFNYKKDKLLKNNLLQNNQSLSKPMIRQLKAFIQQYTNRLIENRLTIRKNQ